MLIRLSFVLSMLVSSLAVQGQEATVVLRSTVTGNQQLPKVLYLLPWQQMQPPELIYQPLQSLVADVFEEVGREEFLRQQRYREKINAAQTNAATF